MFEQKAVNDVEEEAQYLSLENIRVLTWAEAEALKWIQAPW